MNNTDLHSPLKCKKAITVKCPAKINLTLEILNRREDGFHNIQSVMQTIDLFDILTIKIEESNYLGKIFKIKLSGTSDEIPYDEKNLVYKAAELFFRCKDAKTQRCKEKNCSPIQLFTYSTFIHIEKNIPIAAGLAGGSTDAAGTLWGLNKLFDNVLSNQELHALCSSLGSDLNFCLEGGCQLATSRGEILKKMPFQELNVSLIKPKHLGISAKEAYAKFSQLRTKPNLNMTEKLIDALKSGNTNLEEFIHNDLEIALICDYKELQNIKDTYPQSLMSGSGSTFFVLKANVNKINDNFWLKIGLKSIPYGICEK